ncbi:hypothetical protein ACE01N_04775 [Saccharicrinis sp. FJH2]|uniref:hypothetical protein n=1 Tax=unclassified Saccharicrinis TaxID=2646859 RepID=UPI0035D42FF1
MNKITLYLLLLTTMLFTACDNTEILITDLEGSWIVNEVGGNYDGYAYEVTVTVDPNNSSRILIANFLNTANDPETTIQNYMLQVRVEGNRLIVDPQQVDVIEVKNSSGVVSDKDQFRLDYSYSMDNGSYTATAYFIRK